MNCYTVAQIRAIEKAAVEQCGIADVELMQTAGHAALYYCRQRYPEATTFHIFCGPGNNGGDGLVFALAAKKAGLNAMVSLISRPATMGPAGQAHAACVAAGVAIHPASSQVDCHADVIIDALFGIGLTREITDATVSVIAMMNQSKTPIVAIDTPSGVDADTGNILGCAVQADHTITFIGNKCGFYLGAAREYCGQIHVHDLDLPPAAFAGVVAPMQTLDWPRLRMALPARKHMANKGDFGHVLIVGGDYGYAGAACMAGLASARAGAGLVSIATRPEHATSLFTKQPELMAHGIVHPEQCQTLIERASVIVIGAGLGQTDWAKSLTEMVLSSGKPCVIDADALTFFAAAVPLSQPVKSRVITPHPGEAARLLHCTASDIQADRLGSVHALRQQFNAITVLKGANTLVADSQDVISVCDAGNPGMATGGMGDVLSGVIAGLLAQHVDVDSAVKLAVNCHALAGDRAAKRLGERGILATDCLPHIQELLNE